MSDLADGRHARMIAAAVWLSEQGFARIGWASHEDGKAAGSRSGNHWQTTATDDPALVPGLLRGARNALVIPMGRAIIIDNDDARAESELAAAGLPETLTIDSPTPGHSHVYGWVPEIIDMATIPGAFAWGEVRRHDPRTRTASMVLGPWSLRTDGVYTPRGDVRTIAVLPASVIDYLIASGREQDQTRASARGPDDDGWTISNGRHPWLVDRARWLRGNGLSGERLYDELVRLDRDRCRPPLGDDPREGPNEIKRIAGWTDAHIADDPPPVWLVSGTADAGIDAADLLAMDLPPLRMIVPGLLPEGTSVLVSPPKVGKSCFVYQVATEVSLGGHLLGERVESGSALYFALEDGQRRGQDRLRAALAGRTMPRGRLEVRWDARKAGEGLEDDIGAWLDTHEDAALVAIDTLGRVRPKASGKQNPYDVDVDIIGRLQGLFRDRQAALVLVHHSSKAQHDDFVAQVSGTYGISGSVDTIISISRKRLEAFGSISVSGREIAEAQLSVRFDGMLWHAAPGMLSEASAQRVELYEVVKRHGPIWPKAAADRLGMERTAVQHLMAGLVDAGAVARTATGYAVPSIYISPHFTHSNSEESAGTYRGPSWPEEPPLSVDDDGLGPLPGDLTAEALAAFADLMPEAVA